MKVKNNNWLYRAVIFIILFCSVVTSVNSFNNAVEYEILEDIEEIKLSMDYVSHHLDSIEETLRSNLFEYE